MAAYVGWQSSCILKPLLQQGLSDTEEVVICKAVHALTCMCQLGLLQRPHVYEFLSDIGNVRSQVATAEAGRSLTPTFDPPPQPPSCATRTCGSAPEPWASSAPSPGT